MARKKRVSFWATRRVPVKRRVSFRTYSGKKVSFKATKYVPKKRKITFWSSSKGRRLKRRKW